MLILIIIIIRERAKKTKIKKFINNIIFYLAELQVKLRKSQANSDNDSNNN